MIYCVRINLDRLERQKKGGKGIDDWHEKRARIKYWKNNAKKSLPEEKYECSKCSKYRKFCCSRIFKDQHVKSEMHF